MATRGRPSHLNISHTCMPACTPTFTQCLPPGGVTIFIMSVSLPSKMASNRSSERHSGCTPGRAAARVKIPSHPTDAYSPRATVAMVTPPTGFIRPFILLVVCTVAPPRCSCHVHAHSRPQTQTHPQCRCCHHQVLTGGAT